MDLGLEGKRVLVTGSYRGTGAAIARGFGREGAKVLVHAPAEDDAEKMADEIRGAGAEAVAVFGDPATDAGAATVLEGVTALVGGVDVLVNNFGRPSTGTWERATVEDWIDVYQVNTLSAVRMIRQFVPAMKERHWGRVVQIATIGVTRPGAAMPHYYASKAALANLTLSLAKDVAGTGITVNTVSPGLIKTPEVEQWFRHLAQKKGWGDDWDDIERAGVREVMNNPLGRMARPEEVADLVVFVASERAAYLNGAHLRIDGGASESLG